MNRLLISFALSLAVFTFSSTGFAKGAGGDEPAIYKGKWETISTADGFTTERKHVVGSNIFAFRGETIADVSISKILKVFLDPTTRSKWVNMYENDKELKADGDERTYWIRFDTPFPTSDRDYVLHAKGHADHAKRVYTTLIESVTHPEYPENGGCCVRGYAYGTFYRFEAIPGENKTKVKVEVHTDPMGWIPAWLTNMIQKKWPKRTLMSLVREAKKVDAGEAKYASWDEAIVPTEQAEPEATAETAPETPAEAN